MRCNSEAGINVRPTFVTALNLPAYSNRYVQLGYRPQAAANSRGEYAMRIVETSWFTAETNDDARYNCKNAVSQMPATSAFLMRFTESAIQESFL